MRQITYSQLKTAVDRAEIPFNKYEAIFGVPSGGIYPAAVLSHIAGLPMLSEKVYKSYRRKKRVLVIDDLIDSGKTLEKYPLSDSFVCFKKTRKRSTEPTYYYTELPNDWIELPHEKGETGIEEHLERVREFGERFSSYIIVKTSFTGFHRWKSAPKEVDYLRNWHRHIFYVEVRIKVDSLDRELEFFIQKKRLDEFLSKYRDCRFEASCETIASDIRANFGGFEVEVYEDNENGGGITSRLIL